MNNERLAEIQRRLYDFQSYNFGMRNANKLAHEDAPYLLALVREQQARIEAVCDVLSSAAAFGKAVESSDVLDAIRAATEPTP